MHRDKREDCLISYAQGNTCSHKYSRQHDEAEDEEENVEPLCDDCYHEMQRNKPPDRGPENITTEKGEGDYESP